jgi:hypothetical protein
MMTFGALNKFTTCYISPLVKNFNQNHHFGVGSKHHSKVGKKNHPSCIGLVEIDLS